MVVPALLNRLAWQGVSPNPFHRSVQLTLAVPAADEATVRVYDVAGHAVVTLHEPALPGA